MPEINEVIRCDAHNAEMTHRFLIGFDPGLPETFETCVQLYNSLRDCSSCTAEADDSEAIEAAAGAAGFEGTDALRRAVVSGAADPRLQAAQASGAVAALARQDQRLGRGILLLLLWRSYLWIAADLMTLKVSSALGKLRTQVESVGLLALFSEDPETACAWLAIDSEEDGRGFYNRTRARVQSHVEMRGLQHAYSMGSRVALHPRLQSGLLGLSVFDAPDGARTLTQVQISVQECLHDPPTFLLLALYVAATQGLILDACTTEVPGCNEAVASARIALWKRELGRQAQMFRERYPRFALTEFSEAAGVLGGLTGAWSRPA